MDSATLGVLINLIKGQRTLAVSDAVMSILPLITDENGFPITREFTLKKSGSVRLILEAEYFSAADSGATIFINGVAAKNKKFPGGVGVNFSSVSVDIGIKKGDVVHVEAGTGVRLTQVKICASVVDDSLIKIF